MNVALYTAEPILRQPGVLLRRMAGDLRASKDLTIYLFLRNLRAQYRQSFLGYGWIVLQPLVITLGWVALNASGILSLGQTDVPYPLYVLIGSTLWQSFVDAINGPLTQLAGSKTLVAKLNFPREALILAGCGEVLVNTAARLALLVPVMLFFRIAIPPTAILAVLAIMILVAFGTMLGVLLAPLGMLYMDVQRAIGVLTAGWFLVTPIAYAIPTSGPLAVVAAWNPVTPLLLTSRELLLGSAVSRLPEFFVVFGLANVGLLAAWVLYRIAMPHVVARMPAR